MLQNDNERKDESSVSPASMLKLYTHAAAHTGLYQGPYQWANAGWKLGRVWRVAGVRKLRTRILKASRSKEGFRGQ